MQKAYGLKLELLICSNCTRAQFMILMFNTQKRIHPLIWLGFVWHGEQKAWEAKERHKRIQIFPQVLHLQVLGLLNEAAPYFLAMSSVLSDHQKYLTHTSVNLKAVSWSDFQSNCLSKCDRELLTQLVHTALHECYRRFTLLCFCNNEFHSCTARKVELPINILYKILFHQK